MFRLRSEGISLITAAIGSVAIVLCGLMLLSPALGQEAVTPVAVSSTVVDFGPFAQAAVDLLAPVALAVLTGLGGWALNVFRKKTGWEIDAKAGQIVDQALERAVGLALARFRDRTAGGIPIDLKSDAIAAAARYAQERIPDSLRHFGITPGALTEMVEARLEGILIDPSAEANAAMRIGRPIAK